MKVLFYLLIGVFFTPIFVLAQYEEYDFPQQFPTKYKSDPVKEYTKMIGDAPEGLKFKHYKKFAEMTSFNKYKMLSEGHVYLGWDKLEKYLNDVLQVIAPKALKGKPHVHIYPAYMPHFNAFAIHDGTMFVNIGLLAQMEDEAGLAIIIGHELAHYYNEDVYNSYKEQMNVKRSKRNKSEDYFQLNHAHSNREKESKADELGYKWAFDAGYDLSSGVTNYSKMLLVEKESEDSHEDRHLDNVKSNKDQELDLYSSHPLTEDRIKDLELLIKKYNQQTSSQYLVSKTLFEELKKEAVLESIRIAQEQLQFSLSVKLAYKELAINPDNQVALYYFLEGIRKASFTESDYLSIPFLSDEFHSLKKATVKNNPYLIFKDSSAVEDIKYEVLKDTVQDFETYSEAFQFFEKEYKDKITNPEV